MAMPIVIAKNQTGSDIDLIRLGQRVPALGQKILTDDASYTECTEDETLETAVSAGTIVINDGTSDLSAAEGLIYLNSQGNLDGPSSGAAVNLVLKLSDATGTKTEATGVTIDASDNITTSGTINAGGLYVGGSPLKIGDLNDVDTSTQVPTINDSFEWDGSNWAPLKNNRALTNPGGSDDNTQGYAVGSRWLNTASRIEYLCVSDTTGAAVWQSTTAVALKKDGVSVGGPFDLLNFTGDITVTDAGSGQAAINVTLPIPNIAQYRQTVNLSILTSATTVALDTSDFEDSNYSRSGGNITINTTGIYKIFYSVFFDTSQSSRRTVDAWVEKNTVEIMPSRSGAYARNSTDDTSSAGAHFFVSLAATDVIRLRCQSTGTNRPCIGIGNRMWIGLEYVRAV